MTSVLVVAPASRNLNQEGNLLVTGVNKFCIFNHGKCFQMESCHPGMWLMSTAYWIWKRKKRKSLLVPAESVHEQFGNAGKTQEVLSAFPTCCVRPSAIWVFDMTRIAFFTFFFSNCLELRKRVSFLRTVSLHTELCRTLQRCRCRPDWVFVGPVNTPDSAECRRSECVKWEKQGETVEMRPVCKSRWMAWSQPLTSC